MAFRFSLCPVLRIWADTFVPWTRKQVNKNSRSTPFPRPAPLPQREEETIIWTPPLISASLLLFPLSYSLLSFPSLFLPAIKSSNNHDWYRLKCCFKSRTKRDVNIDFYPILDREPQPHHPRFVPPTPARVSCQRWHGLAWKIHKRENQGGGGGGIETTAEKYWKPHQRGIYGSLWSDSQGLEHQSSIWLLTRYNKSSSWSFPVCGVVTVPKNLQLFLSFFSSLKYSAYICQ